MSLVNETTGKTASGNVTVKGGEKFHLVATTANIGSLKGKYANHFQFSPGFPCNAFKTGEFTGYWIWLLYGFR